MRTKYRGNCRVALGALLLVLAGCTDPAAPRSSPRVVVPPPPPLPTPQASLPLGGNPAIYVASADGSAAVTITHGWAPVWSPDGKRMAFYRADGWSYVFDTDSAIVRRLAQGVRPAWSADGRRIVVDRGGSILYVIDVESGSEVYLANGQYPAWSPDGARIAFDDDSGISVINADGTDYHTIVRHGLDAAKYPGKDVAVIRPVWSPNVNFPQIAFTLQDADQGFILGAYVVDADGSNVHGLSGDAPSEAPSWSPNGLRIAFVTWSSAWNGSQWVLSLPGVVVRTQCCETDMLIRLSDGNGIPWSTSWSPDGSVIAFDTQDGIWIGPTGGGDGRNFITDAASIAWSPDRQRIAFIRPSER
jgi:Tol biopolymer transport system component